MAAPYFKERRIIMIQVYSNNVEAGINASIPLKNLSLVKGISSTKEGDTILLNKCGVYKVEIDGSVTIPTGTTVTVQLEVNNVLQSDALNTVTAVADQIIPFHFDKLVQVPFSNTPSPCTSPTSIEIISSVAATYNHINVVVTKIA